MLNGLVLSTKKGRSDGRREKGKIWKGIENVEDYENEAEGLVR